MNIYITLDYVLFLNDFTGDVNHCLLIPTRELLKVLDKHHVQATFFVDMAYVYRLNELRSQYPSKQKDYDDVTEQVKELAQKGQKVGLHLHPQWFYSNYNGKEWIVDFDHYKLSDMPEQEAYEKFVACKEMLEELIDIPIDSFRAGGYSIQTFKPFAKLMRELQIKSDSSVLYKSKNLSNLHYYDYSVVSTSDSYCFKDDIAVKEDRGEFKEYPISTSAFGYLSYCFLKIKMHNIADNSNWGNGGDLPSNHRKSFVKKIFMKMLKKSIMPASIDYQGFVYCEKVFKRYQKGEKKDLVIIGHPKNFSPASLSMLDGFIAETKEKNSYRVI